MPNISTGISRSWNIRNIYLYLVCLVTIFIIIGNLIAFVNSAIDLIAPVENSYNIDTRLNRINAYNNLKKSDSAQEMTFEQYNEFKDEEIVTREQIQKALRIKGLVKNFAAMLISYLFFIFHWKIIRRENKE